MALLTLHAAQLAYGDHPLLDKADFILEPHERVCLVGRNGTGKSTLMKVLANEIYLDDGTMQLQQDIKIARLEQDPPKDSDHTVFDFVSEGLQEIGKRLKRYHELLDLVAEDPSDLNIKQLAKIQEQLDHDKAWHFDNRINSVLEELKLDPHTPLSSLSGGWQRKAALAKALVCEPDILLLDEPTNHLDVATIEWLEKLLVDFSGSIVFISHDRSFIQSMATRIIDLDRGQLTSWPGDYQKYLDGKEEALRVESEQNALFDKKLAQEEVWIRQGIKARRTRNEGRVRALKRLRNERSERRDVMGKANMKLDDATRSGKIVFEAEDLCYSIEDKKLVENFSFNIMRGDRIALIGPNGCGKSTLLKLMLDELKPDSGRLHCGTKLEVAYFDQYRAKLDPEKTVMDNLAEGKTEVDVGGRKRHVMGYLQDFLFHPKRARVPVKALSGGEKNRLLLAKIFLKPNNLLILDEPTNDLDIETLELLEELLSEYKGTLLLVSHDRTFVDNTVTSSWIFSGEGHIEEFVGGYHDAMRQKAQSQPVPVAKPTKEKAAEKKKSTASNSGSKPKKLSYKLQRELEDLPARIEDLEGLIEILQGEINDPDFFVQDPATTQQKLQQLSDAEQELEVAYQRWEELDEMST